MRWLRHADDGALAGDDRAGWSARVSLRERHRLVLRENWRFLLGFVAALLACFAVSSAFATGPFQRGLILGGGVVLVGGLVAAFVVLVSGSAPLMMGELAEQWTAQELRPLRQQGWRLVNHFGLGYGDQDHVLVGPGGVVIVETKWGATPWDLDDRHLFFRMAVDQVLRNAKQLEAWHGVAQFGRPQVDPVLVLWGQASRKLADQPVRRHKSGVAVMTGAQLQGWALRRARDRLTAAEIDGIWSEIQRQAGRRDDHERRTRPMPRSLAELAWGAIATVTAASAGFVVSAQILGIVGSLLLWSAADAGLVVVAEALRRRSRWRWQARAFQGGVAATWVVGALAIARAYLLG